ncbi:MAG: tetratricopeptide repeat protein [Gammaproteobacteria bacterium]|nr:tetratricopeptide repeat protein [Gammaproteobacteria bacterium]
MHRLIKELRRREVFRTLGLYIGFSWIFIEGASVFLPAFDAPDWALRGIIIVAVIGLPVTAVLAWIYDVSDSGIHVQADPTDTVVVPFGGRKTDFMVIGVLAVALGISLYLNITGSRSVVVEALEPISVLIADFDNRTGDELFTGTLEQALQIGIESASFITGYRRDAARKLASTLHSSDAVLDEETARLVSVREGVKLVMVGSIEPKGAGYTLFVRAIDPKNGEVLASVEADAKDKLDVLSAVGTLAGDLREELGDKNIDRQKLVTLETFTAASLEAAQAYSQAQSLQYKGRYEEAMTYYRQALEYDPNFGRAYSGLALSANALGKTEEAEELWEKALATLDTMTERERLRTLGLYYSNVTRNFQKAIETYESLVAKYPSDDAAHNGLAVQYFYALNFPSALREGRVLLDLYPNSVMGRSNYALYAMYASDFETATAEASKVRELDASYFKAWLPIAMNALANGDIEATREAYRQMLEAGGRGVLTATLGLADTAMFVGDTDAAIAAIRDGTAAAEAAGSQYFLATYHMAMAEAQMMAGDPSAASSAVSDALAVSSGLSRQVPAALISIETGDFSAAERIATELGGTLQPQNRAYAQMISGIIALRNGKYVEAIDAINGGIEFADLWLLRYWLGRAYLDAGYFAEALDEFTAAADRHGEATSIFLDDLPTYRYVVTLPYWLARAQQQLGMVAAANANYTAYLGRRPESDPLARDARQRMQ